ncbi:MAG: corrinoid protein, partial [Chloroflexota bacterium]
MGKVGALFEAGEYFVPEMLISARAMQSGMAILKPYLQQTDVKSSGKVVIGTVKGDLHDIGKNLVVLMLEGAGFEVRDLGVDVPVEKFVQAVQEEKPDIVAMSALLTTTMPMMKQTVDALCSAGLREKVRVIIGGAPITEAFAHEIGADGFSQDASRAVSVAKALVV